MQFNNTPARSSAGLEHSTDNREVPGSSPGERTIELNSAQRIGILLILAAVVLSTDLLIMIAKRWF